MSARTPAPPPPALTRWERRTEVPLLAAALVFLAGYAFRVLAPYDAEPWHDISLGLVGATWLLFILDYTVRLRLSGLGHRFPRMHWLDTLVLVMPLLRRCAWSRSTRRSRSGGTGPGSACTPG